MGNAAGVQAANGAPVDTSIGVDELTEDDVVTCLDRIGLGAYKPAFEKLGVEGSVVLDLDRDMLRNDLLVTNEEDIKTFLDIVAFIRNGCTLSQFENFVSRYKKSRVRRVESVAVPSDAAEEDVGALPSEVGADAKDQPVESKENGVARTDKPKLILRKKHALSLSTNLDARRAVMPSPKAKATLGGIGRLNSLCAFTNADPEYWGPDRSRLRAEKKKAKIIRVFLSSTFRDFARERDHLFKNVFPRMEQACAGRGLQFIPIDLRWGVTAEESGRGDVIKLCLQELMNALHFLYACLEKDMGGTSKHRGPTSSFKRHSKLALKSIRGVRNTRQCPLQRWKFGMRT